MVIQKIILFSFVPYYSPLTLIKLLINRISKFNYARVIEWSRLFSFVAFTQLLVQLVGLVCGILIIRLLPTNEYALYTLANTMLGAMTVLGDGGIGAGTMAQGAKVWRDREKLGNVMATGLYLREKFSIGSLLVGIPLLIYFLRQNEASFLMAFLIVLSLIPAFLSAINDTLLEIPLKLSQDIQALQKNQLSVSFARLVSITLTLFIFPWTFIAILTAGLTRMWGNLKLRSLSSKYADSKQKRDPLIQKEILAIVKKILPGSIYYCLSGQISIWLISIFGNTTSLAQIGALGRLSMMLGLFTALIYTVVLPRFARLPDSKKVILSKFFQIQFLLFLLGATIIGLTYLFSNQILWVLGKDYSNLKVELVLSVTGSCASLIAAASFNLPTSRGWVINPLISIPFSIIAIVLGTVLIDISSLMGVLKFNLFIYIMQIIMYYIFFTLKVSKIYVNN